MAATTHRDPYRAYNFRVEFDGVLLAAFAEVSGLTSKSGSVDYRDGITDRAGIGRVVGLQKYPSVTLKRGLAGDPLMQWWRTLSVGGQPERRTLTITLLNETGVPLSRWRIANAWISKIEGPNLSATGNEVAMESIELAHEGVTLE
jgi:phage tail-like protein